MYHRDYYRRIPLIESLIFVASCSLLLSAQFLDVDSLSEPALLITFGICLGSFQAIFWTLALSHLSTSFHIGMTMVSTLIAIGTFVASVPIGPTAMLSPILLTWVSLGLAISGLSTLMSRSFGDEKR